jgi:phosphoglycerol transferase MdoB-like AlkP superfamily enzyme
MPFLLIPAIFIYYLVVFVIGRTLFLIYNYPLLSLEARSPAPLLSSFWHGFSLDASVAAQLLILPWLLLVIVGNASTPLMKKLLKLHIWITTILATLIILADIAIYPDWQMKLNARAILSLRHPSEFFSMVPGYMIALSLLAWTLFSAPVLYVFQRYPLQRLLAAAPSLLVSMKRRMLTFLWLFPIVFFARGGMGAYVLDTSRAYFSKDSTLNDAAANPVYAFGRSVLLSELFISGRNPYQTMPPAIAAKTVELLHHKHQASQAQSHILTTSRPNIVFIVLESWAGDLIASLGGLPQITPHFAELEKSGILFTNFYANGNRTPQGIAAIFAGYPALPNVTVSGDLMKTKKLPRFADLMEKQGYATSLLYGSVFEHGNIKALLMNSGFDRLIEEKDIDAARPRGNIGVHDGFMLDELMRHLDKQPEPFVSGLITLSSHMPFDFPDQDQFHFSGNEAKYINSAMYVDRELGRFFAKIKQSPWYTNTLFVLVADHSRPSHKKRSNWEPGYRRIPLLFAGPVLKPEFQGTKRQVIGSQIDIMATLLHQLGLPATDFPWSKDLLGSTSGFAYYEISDGFGWVSRDGALVYDVVKKKTVSCTAPYGKRGSLQQDGKAYLQVLFQNFMDL